MRTMSVLMIGGVMGTMGFIAGVLYTGGTSEVRAQEKKGAPVNEKALPKVDVDISADTRAKIRAAGVAIKAAMEALRLEGKYESASTSPNAFLILAGGCNSVRDLESGRGVDPETFASLYADQVTDELKQKLGRDREGRVTFNGKIVPMYSVKTLREKLAARESILSEADPDKKP